MGETEEPGLGGRRDRRPLVLGVVGLLVAAIVGGLIYAAYLAPGPGNRVTLTGAGATFPYPLILRWISEYHNRTPSVTINYQSVGSGAGIQQILAGTVDFGASDAPMNDTALAQAAAGPRGPLLHIPETLGGVAVVYNLPGVASGLRLGPDVIAAIFLGDITRWNDARITALNPSVNLPAQPILVVVRSDGSGTTNIFTDYLTKVNATWATRVGKGTQVTWRAANLDREKGNEGVGNKVLQTPYAVGYVGYEWASIRSITYATVENQAGNWVSPSLTNIAAAAATALWPSDPADLRVSITNAPGATSYPIAGFTYLLVYRNQPDQGKGRALVEFIWWAVHEGQAYGPPLQYPELPAEVVQRDEAVLGLVTHRGQPLIP